MGTPHRPLPGDLVDTYRRQNEHPTTHEFTDGGLVVWVNTRWDGIFQDRWKYHNNGVYTVWERLSRVRQSRYEP